jgi:hypothetical protein
MPKLRIGVKIRQKTKEKRQKAKEKRNKTKDVVINTKYKK